MFSNNLFSWALFSGWELAEVTQDKIMFNDFSLTSYCKQWATRWIAVITINDKDLPNINLSTFTSWLSDWWGVLNRRFTKLNIKMDIHFIWDDHNDLLTLIRKFKANVLSVEWNLQITTADDIVITAKASLTKLDIWSISMLDNDVTIEWITFTILDPFFVKKKVSSKLMSWITGALQEVLYNNWVYKIFPKFICTFSAGTVWIIKIWLELFKADETSWYIVEVTENINSWDVLIIDYKEKEVTYNWTIIKTWTGYMSPLEVWTNIFNVDFTGTSVNCEMAVVYNEII